MTEVQSFQPCIDDWFMVTNIEGDRWSIERVVAWALIPGDDQRIPTLQAFGDQGYYLDREEDTYFVKANDKCQTGRSWGEVYDGIKPSRAFTREIEGPLKEALRR